MTASVLSGTATTAGAVAAVPEADGTTVAPAVVAVAETVDAGAVVLTPIPGSLLAANSVRIVLIGGTETGALGSGLGTDAGAAFWAGHVVCKASPQIDNPIKIEVLNPCFIVIRPPRRQVSPG
jgi:hypothetical protein